MTSPSLLSRLLLGVLACLAGITPGCAAAGGSSGASSAPATPVAQAPAPIRYVCEADFLTVEEVAALGLGQDFDESFRTRMGIPREEYTTRALGPAIVSGVAVCAAKGLVKWVAEQLQERAKEYAAQFGGSGVGTAWTAQGGYAALSLKRWKLQEGAAPLLTHHALFILPPVRRELGVYRLEPIYWRVRERAPARTHADEFTAVIHLNLSALWQNSGEPRKLEAAEFTWVLGNYKVGQTRLYAPPAKEAAEGLRLAPASAPFGLPVTDAVLHASFTVDEVDASNAKKYLERLSAAVGKQVDAVGGLVEDKLR